eukprot:TRINITY_DN8454_c0_g1_i1.p1 TRINITY_DN8454_c0_g1~~TRINITY_DN8454_c0_g1_i1.p1  ORF type:complete len:300 (+),score=65.73 TRINITY_DN8454_c0_g1_i1:59-958(+)
MASLPVSILQNFAYSCVSTSIWAPLERVRIILQCDRELVNKKRIDPRLPSDTLNTAKRLIKEEGILSLWRGNSFLALRSLGPNQLSEFLNIQLFRRLFHLLNGRGYSDTFSRLINLALFNGTMITSLFYLYPLDFLRVRWSMDLQVDGEREYEGVVDLCRKVYRKEGITGFYSGLGASILGMIAYRFFYHQIVGNFGPMLNHVAEKQRSVAIDIFMFAAPIAAGILSYPFDTIRKRMMMNSGEEKKYFSTYDALVTIISEEGWSSLFRGVELNVVKSAAIPFIAATYSTFVRPRINKGN